MNTATVMGLAGIFTNAYKTFEAVKTGKDTSALISSSSALYTSVTLIFDNLSPLSKLIGTKINQFNFGYKLAALGDAIQKTIFKVF